MKNQPKESKLTLENFKSKNILKSNVNLDRISGGILGACHTCVTHVFYVDTNVWVAVTCVETPQK
jgi:hypothetical protein